MWTFLVGIALELTKFVSPDHSFELSVPAGYTIVTGSDKERPICSNYSAICAIYPGGSFKGTNFARASVEVSVLPGETEQTCMNLVRNDSSSRTIDGTRFSRDSSGDGVMGTRIDSDRYIGFSKGKCFELTTRITYVTFANYDPGAIKEFTRQDEKRLNAQLVRILDSFRAF